MANLSTNDKQILEKLFKMGSGYVLNFSDRSFAEFFADDIGVNIADQRYAYISGSKANRLRRFWQVAEDSLVGKSIDKLLDYINGQIVLTNLKEDDFDQNLMREARGIATRLRSDEANLDLQGSQNSAMKNATIQVSTNRIARPPDVPPDPKNVENSGSVAPKRWWKDPSIIVALIGLIGVLAAAYLQFVYKPVRQDNTVTVGFIVHETGTTKFIKNAKVILQLSTTHDERQTDSSGFVRFGVNPEKDTLMQVTVSAIEFEDGSFNIGTPKGDRNFDLYLDRKTPAKVPELDTPHQTILKSPTNQQIVAFTFTNVTAEGIKCSNGRTEKRDVNGGWAELIPTGKDCQQIVTITYEELGEDSDWFYLWDTGRHMTARYPKRNGFVNWVPGKVAPNQAASTQWNVSQEVTRVN